MNVYNYTYCYFHNLWKNKGGGRIDSSAHVLFSVIIHILLLSEIIRDLTGFNLISLPYFGEYGRNKMIYFFLAVPLWLGLFFFYSRERTKRLLKEYQLKYGEEKNKNTLRILLYVVLPTVLLITLAVIRQNRN